MYCGPPSRCASFPPSQSLLQLSGIQRVSGSSRGGPRASATCGHRLRQPNQGRGTLPGIKLKENESFEGAMKRFKKQCEKAGIMYELRRREHYEKPSVRRKKKALAARKRAIKKLRAAGP